MTADSVWLIERVGNVFPYAILQRGLNFVTRNRALTWIQETGHPDNYRVVEYRRVKEGKNGGYQASGYVGCR